jgi:hypothetical protein
MNTSLGAAAVPPSWGWTSQDSPTSRRIFKRMQERPSIKKLLAYEKEVNEGFAKKHRYKRLEWWI